MKTRSILALMLAALPLSACNMVISEKPWFTEASGPQLKDGLWANLESPDCKVDPAAPIDAWPACASPIVVKGNFYSGPPSGRGPESAAMRADPAKWEQLPHVLVDGDPQVDQMLFEIEDSETVRVEKQGPIYIYLALRPVRKDAEGRIIETQRWPVLCGPMPEEPRMEGGQPVFVSEKPFRGIRVEKEICVAESADALRAAAASSEAVAEAAGMTKVTSVWIRPGVN